MTNTETMKAFINGGKESGHNSTGSIFFEKNIVYSYGYHFPLGIKLENKPLIVNSYSYSNTTAKHKIDLYNANGWSNFTIEAPTPAMKALAGNDLKHFKKLALDYHKDELKKAELKLSRARTTKNYWQREIKDINKQIKAIKALT